MMDAVVQLLRNAMCCIKDLGLFRSTFLWDASIPMRYYDLPEPLHQTTPLEVLISLSQLYVVYSACTSGLIMLDGSLGKLRRIERLLDNRSNPSSDADRLINASLIKEGMFALRSLFIGLLIFFIGVSFFWLFANSWHVTETNWIGGLQGLVHALTVAEVCLLPLLYYMYKDGSEQLAKALRMERLAKLMKEGRLTSGEVGLTSYEVLTDWKPFWDAGVSVFAYYDASQEPKWMQAETEKVTKTLESLVGKSGEAADEKEAKVRATMLADKADELLTSVQVTRLEGYREYLYFVVNLVAFYGYLLSIIVFYFEDEAKQPSYVRHMLFNMTNPDADWSGNFAGDLMWTIEPAIILSSPVLLNAVRSSSRKKKIKAD